MPRPKNILVLMCDHHRFDALSCLGNSLAHTPNLDALAARGMRFTNCFNQAPVCAPTRHSLATGRYCHAHGVITNRHKPFPGMRTIAHALQPLGYRRFNQGHMHWTDRTLDSRSVPHPVRAGRRADPRLSAGAVPGPTAGRRACAGRLARRGVQPDW